VFGRLAKMVGHEEWIEDPKFESHTARGMNQKELDDLISDWSKQKTADELLDTCSEAGVPAGKIYRASDMLDDPHFAAREAIVSMQHPTIGKFKMQNVFPKLSDTPGEVKWVGPELGEHNDYVYGELLGMSKELIEELKSTGNV
jgi:succinyl-CoA--D-citramalate CoA-transferase